LQCEGLGKWDVAWGPSTFRTPTSFFDDVMVYIARQLDRPAGDRPRYAVAIRGTNPISALDWVLGDFWVQLQIDWPSENESTAKISASTALGLAVIQHVSAENPPSIGGRFTALANDVAGALQSLAHALPGLMPDRVMKSPASISDTSLLQHVGALTDASGTRRKSF